MPSPAGQRRWPVAGMAGTRRWLLGAGRRADVGGRVRHPGAARLRPVAGRVRVRLVGFVAPAEGSDGSYRLTRFTVFCCAADAEAFQAVVRGDHTPTGS